MLSQLMDRIDDNVIVGTKTGITSKIVEKNGMYVHPMTITRKKKKNDMDIGNLGMIEEVPKGQCWLDIKEGKYTAASILARPELDEEGRMEDGLWVPF